MKRYYPIFVICAILEMQCNPCQPSADWGSIDITFRSEPGVQGKAADKVGAVHLTLWKGGIIRSELDLVLVVNNFYGRIEGLIPGDDYAVRLLGRRYPGDQNILGKAEQAGIEVLAGGNTSVELVWRPYYAYPLSPFEGEQLKINRPKFTWRSTQTALDYSFRIDDNPNFMNVLVWESGVQDTQWTVSAPLPNGRYYWEIACRDTLGYNSSWSPVRSFTISVEGPGPPDLLLPEDGAVTDDRFSAFTWTDAEGAAGYALELALQENFESTILYSAGVTGTEHTPSTALANADYFWRVASKDELGNQGGWSSARSFTIDAAEPDAPLLISPLHQETVTDSTVILIWEPVTGAAGYRIDVSRDSTFQSTVISRAGLDKTTYTASGLSENGACFWRVAREYAGGLPGKWSEIRTFFINRLPYTPF